jgi:hypothetical protein
LLSIYNSYNEWRALTAAAQASPLADAGLLSLTQSFTMLLHHYYIRLFSLNVISTTNRMQESLKQNGASYGRTPLRQFVFVEDFLKILKKRK